MEVKDQGPGIAFAELEKVFDKFYRLDNETNRKNPGTGLGLPICRALVNLHGGKIWVESEPNQGCQFPLHLAAQSRTGRKSKDDGAHREAVS